MQGHFHAAVGGICYRHGHARDGVIVFQLPIKRRSVGVFVDEQKAPPSPGSQCRQRGHSIPIGGSTSWRLRKKTLSSERIDQLSFCPRESPLGKSTNSAAQGDEYLCLTSRRPLATSLKTVGSRLLRFLCNAASSAYRSRTRKRVGDSYFARCQFFCRAIICSLIPS